MLCTENRPATLYSIRYTLPIPMEDLGPASPKLSSVA